MQEHLALEMLSDGLERRKHCETTLPSRSTDSVLIRTRKQSASEVKCAEAPCSGGRLQTYSELPSSRPLLPVHR